eukprot:gene14975-21032_t
MGRHARDVDPWAASLYGTGIGRTVEGNERENFVKMIEEGLNMGRDGEHTSVDAGKPWKCSEQVLHNWCLRGKSQQQVVLAVVVSHVTRLFYRSILRQTYDKQKSGNNFDMAFAVGHPTTGDVAQEEAQYLVKIDDDTYVNFPHFFGWMESKQLAFNNTPNVMFGEPLQRYYYSGALYGLSTHLVKEIIHQVESRFIASRHEDYRNGGLAEDALAGAWVRMYSSNVTDIEIDEDRVDRNQSLWSKPLIEATSKPIEATSRQHRGRSRPLLEAVDTCQIIAPLCLSCIR